jgi:hypothetical protein
MSQTVFVLGAGASRDAGGPLMFDFLDIAERLMRSDEVGDAKASFELVFKESRRFKRSTRNPPSTWTISSRYSQHLRWPRCLVG